ncbi:MAG: sugar phosphate nucleotidyltransferase, partial [Candidatus Yonathbacteria bacterium]|nr:sugar phosphate nucleotidyltransferase [Candidatus Yonathbacteria bacterium]
MYLLNDVIGVVLAGGRGNRLLPLTAMRAKPSVPFGGKWIIADLALWSLYNSGIRTIKVLAQYISQPLIQHVQRSWPLRPHGEPHVEVVPAQMRVHDDWYLGTADAVYQNLDLICRDSGCFPLTAIFAADHVFKIDVGQMREFHDAKGSQFTVCAKEMLTDDAAGKFGVLIVDEKDRVIGFEEKPEKPKEIPGKPGYCYASMGNYLADSLLLKEALEKDARDESSSHDFGNDVIPELIRGGVAMFAYNFAHNTVPGQEGPYWVDVGTIKSYWAANMDLVGPLPILNLYSEEWPILPRPDSLPPAKYARAG